MYVLPETRLSAGTFLGVSYGALNHVCVREDVTQISIFSSARHNYICIRQSEASDAIYTEWCGPFVWHPDCTVFKAKKTMKGLMKT